MNEKEITINLKTEQKPLYFRDVKYDSFFIDEFGQLCQRWGSNNAYNVIAKKDGKCSHRFDNVAPNRPIERLVNLKFSM